MEITFIGHSCFLIELPDVYLLFDYYRGELPELKKEKELIIFSSHTHSDHFNPKIFEFSREKENCYYILSYDIEDKITHRKMLEREPQVAERFSYMRYDEEKQLPLGSGKHLVIRTLKSTDRGVGYVAELDGKRIFHPGDLYLWVWETESKAKRNDMIARFQRELDKLKGQEMDVAFLPLDHRLENCYALGWEMFCKSVKAGHIFPMHMWEKYELQDRLRGEEAIRPYLPYIEKVEKQGQRWII